MTNFDESFENCLGMLGNFFLCDEKSVLELIESHGFGSISVLEKRCFVDSLSEGKTYHIDEVIKVACNEPAGIFWGSF